MAVQILVDPALVIQQPLSEAITATAAAGYDGIELGNRPDAIPPYAPLVASFGELEQFGAEARRQGVPVGSVAVIQSWANPDEEARTDAVRWFKQGIEATVAVGAKRINTELTGSPHQAEASRQAWLKSIEEVLPLIERHGLELRVEPHPGDFIETTTGALELLAEVNHPALAYLHCLPHSFYLGGSITEQIAQARPALDHIHLADTFRPIRTILNPPVSAIRIHQHFDIGWGEINWRETQSALVGYDGIATVQIYFWNDRAAQSLAANRAAAGWLLAAPQDAAPRELTERLSNYAPDGNHPTRDEPTKEGGNQPL